MTRNGMAYDYALTAEGLYNDGDWAPTAKRIAEKHMADGKRPPKSMIEDLKERLGDVRSVLETGLGPSDNENQEVLPGTSPLMRTYSVALVNENYYRPQYGPAAQVGGRRRVIRQSFQDRAPSTIGEAKTCLAFGGNSNAVGIYFAREPDDLIIAAWIELTQRSSNGAMRASARRLERATEHGHISEDFAASQLNSALASIDTRQLPKLDAIKAADQLDD